MAPGRHRHERLLTSQGFNILALREAHTSCPAQMHPPPACPGCLRQVPFWNMNGCANGQMAQKSSSSSCRRELTGMVAEQPKSTKKTTARSSTLSSTQHL